VEVAGGVAQSDVDHGVFDLPPIAVVLSLGADGVRATLGDSRLVDQANRFGIGVLRGDQLLAAIDHALLVPLDAFQESL
jgi:hypothetical protein